MKLQIGLVALGLAAALVAPAVAAEVTLKGEIVSQMCYLEDSSHHGEEHKACSVECAQNGEALALLADDGTLYTITGELAADNNVKLIPHVSHIVELTGEVSEQGGSKSIAAVKLAMAK